MEKGEDEDFDDEPEQEPDDDCGDGGYDSEDNW